LIPIPFARGMATRNVEGYTSFDIDPLWHRNRPRGLSAVVRCMGDDDKIGLCLGSCVGWFDEVVVTCTPVDGDCTEEIVSSFTGSGRVKYFEYPFNLKPLPKYDYQREKWLDWGFHRVSNDSVHDMSYYTNWGMSLTRYSHVAPRWDVDHVLRSDVVGDGLKSRVLDHSHTFVRGVNVTDRSCVFADRDSLFYGFECRFRRADPFCFFPGSLTGAEGDSFLRVKSFDALAWQLTRGWLCSVYSLYRFLLGDVVFVREPLYFHLKYGVGGEKIPKAFHRGYWKDDGSVVPVRHGFSIPEVVINNG